MSAVTILPPVDSPVDAIPRHDGTTGQHWTDHGHVTDVWINAKEYLKGDGTLESVGQFNGLVEDGAGKRTIWPPGTYHLPAGSGVALANGMHHTGVHRQTIISVEDAYAFSMVDGLTDIKIDGFRVNVRSGSVTGGALKTTTGGGVVGSMRVRDVYADGGAALATLTGALWHLEGWINNVIEGCQASSGAIGFLLQASPFSNANSMRDCRAASQTTAGMKLIGAQGLLVEGCTFESNTGYGVWLSSENMFVEILRNWFESNTGHDVFIDGALADSHSIQVRGNNFSGTGGATQNHVKVTAGAATSRAHHVIEGNEFRDLAGSGVNISLGANVTHSKVAHNRGASVANGTIVDLGGANHINGNDNTTNIPDDDYYPGNIRHRFGAPDASHNWTDIRGDGATDYLLNYFRGAVSTSQPRIILHPNLVVDGVGNFTGLMLGKATDATSLLAHGGAVVGDTDTLRFTAGDGAAQVTAAYVKSDTFGTLASKLGFRGSTPITKATVTGSRGGNAALASLLTKLADLGLITDGSS